MQGLECTTWSWHGHAHTKHGCKGHPCVDQQMFDHCSKLRLMRLQVRYKCYVKVRVLEQSCSSQVEIF